MESLPSQNPQSSLTMQATTTKDFLDQLKDFLTASLIHLQNEGKIPQLVKDKKQQSKPQKARKGSKGSGAASSESDGERKSPCSEPLDIVKWEFDAKDSSMVTKYGNFSSSTIIKLVSKFKKANEGVKVDAKSVAEILSQELNRRLEEDQAHQYTLVHSEVLKFDHLNGFLNLYLQNEQFMDRVQLMIRKKHNVQHEGHFGGAGAAGDDASEAAFVIKPIGFLESCFREKFGTPRQSGFVKNARARLTLVNEINSSCLEGLDEYSYIWVIFVFHVGLHDYNPRKTKITPPKAEGAKKGVFATRSPHRYNPIGLSIAKLESIDDRTITISGIDLIHGTPVLDIKPYHYLDSLDKEELRFPKWLEDSKDRGRLQIQFGEESLDELKALVDKGQLDFYSSFDEAKELIQSVFELNPHSIHTINKHKEGIYAVALDNMNIIYKMNEEKTQITIVKILWCDNTQPKEKLRTKEWLLKISELIDKSPSPIAKVEEQKE